KRTEDHVRALRDGMCLIDHLERCHANRAARSMHQLDLVRQKPIDSVFDDAMGLPTANFHQHPRPSNDALDFIDDFSRELFATIFVEIFHVYAAAEGGDSKNCFAASASSTSGIQSSPNCWSCSSAL